MNTWKVSTQDGRSVEVTWSCAQTSFPTGALNENTDRRTRYFFDVVIDELYYYGNRFLTSPDAEGVTDTNGRPILTRIDLILPFCAERAANELDKTGIDHFPNDLGFLDLERLVEASAS